MKHVFKPSAIIAAAMLLANPVVHAQTQEASFTGASVAISVGATRNKVGYAGFLTGSAAKTDVVGQLDLSYGFKLAPQWVLGVGAAYDLNNTDFGSINYVSDGATNTVHARMKNHYSIYVAPGYRFSPTSLAYVKLGWHSAKGEFNDSLTGTGTSTHNGTGYGLGVASMLARQVEARFEIQYVNFSREFANLSNGKPDMIQALVSVGYRF